MSATLLLALVSVLLLAVIGLLAALLRRSTVDLAPLHARLDAMERGQERTERALRDEIAQGREDATRAARALREEVHASLTRVGDSVLNRVGALADSNDRRLDAMRGAVETKLQGMRDDNGRQLEKMRQTVDEKLQGALERRLGESFRLVSERLEQVHQGLGEMQTLAHGVGDLKKVLSNVKVRGNWGEVQLGNLLEQVLTPDQYAVNVATREGSPERVEFAVKLPGRGGDDAVWLPIDAKFPQEDYQRLLEAQERADAEGVDAAARALEVRIRGCARDICDKYLDPPHTTDFAILFLPTEGLYAETIRRTGLVEYVQRECRVMIAGPTTLFALLNSLQMGFRTLAIQKRSGEVWGVLGAVKTEFGKFGGVIQKVQKKLQEASNVMDQAAVRTRAIDRRLRDVEALPTGEAPAMLLPVTELALDGVGAGTEPDPWADTAGV